VSGFAVIAYSSGVRWGRCLYFRSPNDLVRFKFPSTLPSVITLPDFSILSISIYPSGLWSILISTSVPPLPKTHLESPALETNIFFLILSIYTTFDVQPIASSIISSFDYTFGSFLSFSSPKIFKIAGFFGGFSLRRSPTAFSPSLVRNSSSTFKNDYLSHSYSLLL